MRVVAHRGSDSPVQTTPRALQGTPVVRPNLFRLLWLAITLFSSLSRADYTTTLNPTNTYGTWDGWGASLCWWARVFGTRNDLADLMFTTNFVTLNGQSLPGLGLTMARYNLGACTTNSINGDHIQLSANIPAHRQMPGYWLDWSSSDPASTSWNWTADANQLSMLQKAKARGVNLFELFSNSPLWWMCANHNPSGADNGANDNLQSWNQASHAAYLGIVAQYARDHWGDHFHIRRTLQRAHRHLVDGSWHPGRLSFCHQHPGRCDRLPAL